MDKRAKQAVLGTALVLTVILILGIAALVRYLSPGTEVMKLSEYYNVPRGEAMIILDDKIYEKNALLLEDAIYVDLDTVKERFNKRFYWDANENVLVYASPTQIIKAKTDCAEYQVDQEIRPFGHSVVKKMGDKVYLSLEFVSIYSAIRYDGVAVDGENGKPVIQRVMIKCNFGDYLFVDVTKNTQIRTEPDRKSKILMEIEPETKLMLLDGGGTQENGYLKVMTEDGVRGFVRKKHVGEGYYAKVESDSEMPEYTSIQRDEEIHLIWHLITNPSANANLDKMLADTKGISVLSPTWFSINSNEGTISSLASEDYVSQAHAMGLEVWGLVDNFGTDVSTYQVLSRTSTRERLVNEIIAAAVRYHLDGINIDFESLSLETGPHFIEFLRELSAKCRNNRLVLSVDNYVPANYNKYYDYKEQGVVVDYVVIMAYDEHYAGSEEAGSVASISYVENAISDTLEMVPADKIIMAVPFYTRLWKESAVDGVLTLTSEALGMESARLTLEANGAVPEWEEETGQYYAEYDKDGTHYRIWLEEEESLGRKADRIREASLAGIAAWRLGYERDTVWDVIFKYGN